MEGLLAKTAMMEAHVSEEMEQFFNQVFETLEKFKHVLEGSITNTDRKSILDGLGNAGSTYRMTIYKKSFSGKKKSISKEKLINFIQVSLQYVDHSIAANKREDNLYHAYNLITLENEKEISISYLPLMLEGQVSVLSSGYLSAKASLSLLDSLKKSALYRKDQNSYILYPNKELSRFVDKNNIPTKKIEKLDLVKKMVKEGNSQIIEKDVQGNYHFSGNFNNAQSVKNALKNLPEKDYKSLIEKDENVLLELFEEVFNHKYFTGRSGTFFGYEGLGSIYWHMVSKLALAVQEVCFKAINSKEDEQIIQKLAEHYHAINEGIGIHKSPEVYGAFPTDPYSHTPAGKGAQQPGMTGQVKEDVLSRFGELGIVVSDGKIQFKPSLLRKKEFLASAAKFKYIDINQQEKEILLAKNSLGFTYCQAPIVYKITEKNSIEILFSDGKLESKNGLELDAETSKKLFERTGEIVQIKVYLQDSFI
jgi:hypothetical protein